MSSLRSIIVPALAMVLVSCSRSDHPSPTAPAPPNVTVLVTDPRGAPAPAYVAAHRVEPPGAETSTYADSTGIATLSLSAGRWLVWAQGFGNGHGGMVEVAAAVGTVGGRPAGARDTTLFRLGVAPEAFASGTILLAGGANPIDTRVSVEGLPLSSMSTDPGGFWSVRGLPLGHWTARAVHDGFQTVSFDLVVSAPGAYLTTGTSFTMQPK